MENTFPLFDSYLDNLQAIPIILSLVLVERQYLFKRGKTYRLSELDVVIATVFIASISEIVFPLLTEKFTLDWWNVVFFGLGSLLFYTAINTIPGKLRDRDASSQ